MPRPPPVTCMMQFLQVYFLIYFLPQRMSTTGKRSLPCAFAPNFSDSIVFHSYKHPYSARFAQFAIHLGERDASDFIFFIFKTSRSFTLPSWMQLDFLMATYSSALVLFS